MSHALYPAFRLSRQRLLISCATLAIAAALAPQRASAQAFQGTPTTAAGTISFDRATVGSETITVGTTTATVNWAPTDSQGVGNINFLPAGNTATYQGATGLADFTVLNRIVPTDATRKIELNGSVFSKLAGGATGGNVWFYSPGGILIGSQAVLDVGGLLLSSIDLPSGFSTSSTGFTASFSKSQTNAGSIQVMPGAQINARNSYVAIVAPRIEQGGNIQVNGSAAYAAADQLTMTMSQGLFDIEVPLGAGTSDANGVVHTGTTGGAANSTASNHHSIYMVAVPKNQALTMLLGGTIGFAQAAAGATVRNGQIVLSAGSSMNDLGGGHAGSAEAGANGGIYVGSEGAATFTSDVFGLANGSILVDATAGDVTFAGDLSLQSKSSTGPFDLALVADNGHRLTINGTSNLAATLDRRGPAATASDSADVTAGNILIESNSGGTITTGNLLLDASAYGQDNAGGGDKSGGDGTGGHIAIVATGGGKIQVNGAIDAHANGTGGNMLDGSTHGGKGQGGSVQLFAADANSSITTSGHILATASGFGGSYSGPASSTLATGGDGFGGDVVMLIQGSLTAGAMTFRAIGTGGDGGTTSSGVGGNGGLGHGGSNTVLISDGASADAAIYTASVNGFGGAGGAGTSGRGNGGSAQGGANAVMIDGHVAFGGTSTEFTGLVVTAFAQGGDGATGGIATAGSSSIAVNGALDVAGHLQSTAQAQGGNGTSSYGSAKGGSASITANGNLAAGDVFVGANATGGNGTTESGSIGGNAKLTIGPGAVTHLGDVSLSALGAGGLVGVTGDLTATGRVELDSDGDIIFGNVAADHLNFSAGGAVTGGNVNAATRAEGDAQGAVVLGNITVGPNLPGNDDFSVGFSSGTSITVGNVSGPGNVGFATLGNLSTGNLTAGNLVMTLVGGNTTTGSITTAADGRVYMADASMFLTGGGGSNNGDNFDPNIVLALAPVPTHGSTTINGPVTTGRLQAAAGTDLSIGNAAVGHSAELTAGRLANFHGTVSAPQITVTSHDLNVAAGASLGVNGVTNLLTLNAVSGTPIYIG
ncbi:MAG: beta strand repeat-containing protein, partial [Sphingomicrobium sp.]